MKTNFTLLLAMIIVFVGNITKAQVVITNDSIFNTAQEMFLANELFESGEPFAEDLGYDLDELDPMVLNMPDSISYTSGIEGYEYSRYLLNTLNGRSGMGLHMMWSPVVMANAAAQPDEFDGSITGTPNGYKEDDMLMMMIGNFGANANQTPFAHAWPQFADFMEGNTYLPQTVDSNFGSDFLSTRWNRSKMTKTLNMGAMGQSMLKQYFWAQDMLGGFHDGNDEGVDPDGTNSPDLPDSPVLDPDNDIFYGGNNVDGFIGQVLTAVSINKTMFMINNMVYDGTTLGAVNPATYNPADGIKYIPTHIGVTEGMVLAGLPPSQQGLTVLDPMSQLSDQWSYLLATTSYMDMMNPMATDADHYGYREVFDGYPFPASASETGTPGPFDLMKGTSKVIFLNTMMMHFNSTMGTFVNQSSLDALGAPQMGSQINAVNAGYIMLTLSQVKTEFAGTPLEDMANNALISQANFIMANFKDPNGGFYNQIDLNSGASTSAKTIGNNAALIRGLYAAYEATNDEAYLTAANEGYNFVINNFYSPAKKAFRTTMGQSTAIFTPLNLALFSGMMREATTVGGQTDAPTIYTRVFKKIYNKMILTEAQATGEEGNDSDGDSVPYIGGGTLPFVFAAEATMANITTDIIKIDKGIESINVLPNPASDRVSIQLNLDKNANIDISIYNVAGQLVLTQTERQSTGLNNFDFDISTLSEGQYFIRVGIDRELIAIEKLTVIK